MKLHAHTLVMVLLLFPYIKSRAAAPDSLITSDSTAVTNAFELHMELVSQYVWRGQLLDRNPQLQPVLEFSAGPLLLGACASHSLGSSFSEIDLYAAFSTKRLTIAVYDYYYMDLDHLDESPFFRYRNTDSLASPHTLDANVILNDVFIPNLSLTASVFFAGDDHNDLHQRQYSNYLALDYAASAGAMEFIFSLGGTLSSGFYASQPAFTQISMKAMRNIPINGDFAIDLSGNLAYNPDNQHFFFVFGIKI